MHGSMVIKYSCIEPLEPLDVLSSASMPPLSHPISVDSWIEEETLLNHSPSLASPSSCGVSPFLPPPPPKKSPISKLQAEAMQARVAMLLSTSHREDDDQDEAEPETPLLPRTGNPTVGGMIPDLPNPPEALSTGAAGPSAKPARTSSGAKKALQVAKREDGRTGATRWGGFIPDPQPTTKTTRKPSMSSLSLSTPAPLRSISSLPRAAPLPKASKEPPHYRLSTGAPTPRSSITSAAPPYRLSTGAPTTSRATPAAIPPYRQSAGAPTPRFSSSAAPPYRLSTGAPTPRTSSQQNHAVSDRFKPLSKPTLSTTAKVLVPSLLASESFVAQPQMEPEGEGEQDLDHVSPRLFFAMDEEDVDKEEEEEREVVAGDEGERVEEEPLEPDHGSFEDLSLPLPSTFEDQEEEETTEQEAWRVDEAVIEPSEDLSDSPEPPPSASSEPPPPPAEHSSNRSLCTSEAVESSSIEWLTQRISTSRNADEVPITRSSSTLSRVLSAVSFSRRSSKVVHSARSDSGVGNTISVLYSNPAALPLDSDNA